MTGRPDERLPWPKRLFRWLLYYVVAVPVLQVVTRVTFGLRVRGRKNLKGLDSAVLCCNHVHYLDCAMMVCAVAPRRVTFASQAGNFRLPVAGWLVEHLGCISVGETVQETKQFLLTMSQRLRRGDWFGIFPEGELRPYCDTLREFREGAFQIAVMAGVPVVPMVIVKRPKRGWRRLNRKPPLTLRIGEPVWPPESGTPKERRRNFCAACYEAMSVIREERVEERSA